MKFAVIQGKLDIFTEIFWIQVKSDCIYGEMMKSGELKENFD